MQQIADWLKSLGLSEYAQRFAENDIDFSILGELTDQDLEKIGIASLGHRRKLLRAIANLEAVEWAAPAAAVVSPSASAPSDTAERRQVTVMFSDLVGSTALSARMDPEDLREVIAAYHKCVAEIVRRFEGFVAQYLGDGVLVYFGYPHAHEDDAERAVRAGLALIAAVGALKMRAPLQTRVGIATGLVVVGDLLDAGKAHERGIIGETPNLAARLQGIAQPNTVVIAEATRKLLGSLFELQDIGTSELKGMAGLVPAWAVLRASSVESRFEALHTTGVATLVGRDEEVELLMRRWKQVKTGEGRAVLISGEPGIGKSRLTAAVGEHIGTEPHTRLRYFCSPHYQDSALYPFIVQLERAAGFTRGDQVETKLDKLRRLITPGMRDDDDIELLSELLSLPNSAADLNLSPQRRREKVFEALLTQLETVSRQRPALVIFEDAHWIDPTSRELLDLAVDRMRRLPILLIITFRPEFQPPWAGRSHVTTLVLNRLDERDGAALAQELAGNTVLAAGTVAEIVERTDGVPLFVEELTKAVLESAGQEDRVAAVMATKSVAALSVPAALHASLMARLDRLGGASKEIAQIGAVLGREFTYELIESVARRERTELEAALGQLSEAGLLFCRGTPPHSSYLFKHALVQDAAYDMLLRGRRQELHARVAAVLEQDFADVVGRQPELLAHHLTGSGDTERAVDQWLKAGRHAAARSAHLEAIGHFERGLAALAALAEGRARDDRELELQLARGLSLFTAQGFMSAEAAQAYARAHELAEQRGDSQQLFIAVYGLWQSANGAGNILDCRRLSTRLQQLTVDNEDDELRLQAHHSAWATCLFFGEPTVAREHCEEGRILYDPERHRFLHQLYGGHDPGTCARYFGAQVQWLLGYPDKGVALGSEALQLAERIAHPFSLALALQYNSMLLLDRGEPELALQRLEMAEALAAEQRVGLVLEPQLLRGTALTAQGAFEEAVACFSEGLAGPAGTTRLRCYGLAMLADALLRQGKHGAAVATAREGLDTVAKTGHRQWKAELHRLEGVGLCGLNRLEEGETALEEALRTARSQQAKAYELRAATSLARLWSDQRKRHQARDLLAPVYGWFVEGLDTRDLKEAKSLLDMLAA
jgi:class 3 adenylate cyclase/predicted ATPase